MTNRPRQGREKKRREKGKMKVFTGGKPKQQEKHKNAEKKNTAEARRLIGMILKSSLQAQLESLCRRIDEAP